MINSSESVIVVFYHVQWNRHTMLVLFAELPFLFDGHQYDKIVFAIFKRRSFEQVCIC